MLTYAVIAAVIAIICYALARNRVGLPFTHIAYLVAGGLALLFLVVWLIALVTGSGPLQVTALGTLAS